MNQTHPLKVDRRTRLSDTTEEHISFSLILGDLLRALALILKVTPRPGTYPEILTHVHLEAGHGLVVMSATNLQISLSLTLPAYVTQPGVLTIPARALRDGVSSFPKGGQITITAGLDDVQLVSGSRTAVLSGATTGDDFPDIHPVALSPSPTIHVDSAALSSAIKEVRFAASRDDDPRSALTAICLAVSSDVLSVVATDEARLALRVLEHSSQSVDTTHLLVSVPSMNLVADALPNDGTVHLTWDEKRATFQADSVIVSTRLVVGTFADYRRYLCATYQTTFTLPRLSLLQTLETLKPYYMENHHILQVEADRTHVTFTAKSEEHGISFQSCETEVTGRPSMLKLSAHFLMQMLRAVKADAFTFSLRDAVSPLLVVPVGRSDYHYLFAPLNPRRS